jgi:hypothetical protein
MNNCGTLCRISEHVRKVAEVLPRDEHVEPQVDQTFAVHGADLPSTLHTSDRLKD